MTCPTFARLRLNGEEYAHETARLDYGADGRMDFQVIFFADTLPPLPAKVEFFDPEGAAAFTGVLIEARVSADRPDVWDGKVESLAWFLRMKPLKGEYRGTVNELLDMWFLAAGYPWGHEAVAGSDVYIFNFESTVYLDDALADLCRLLGKRFVVSATTGLIGLRDQYAGDGPPVTTVAVGYGSCIPSVDQVKVNIADYSKVEVFGSPLKKNLASSTHGEHERKLVYSISSGSTVRDYELYDEATEVLRVDIEQDAPSFRVFVWPLTAGQDSPISGPPQITEVPAGTLSSDTRDQISFTRLIPPSLEADYKLIWVWGPQVSDGPHYDPSRFSVEWRNVILRNTPSALERWVERRAVDGILYGGPQLENHVETISFLRFVPASGEWEAGDSFKGAVVAVGEVAEFFEVEVQVV